jgi:hypothetical protein
MLFCTRVLWHVYRPGSNRKSVAVRVRLFAGAERDDTAVI